MPLHLTSFRRGCTHPHLFWCLAQQYATAISRNPFIPSSTAVNTTSPSQSARPVTLPYVPEFYSPLAQTLDALLPYAPRSESTIASPLSPVKPSPFMDALRDVENRTRTWNDAPAYKSTLSPTLDAFVSLNQLTKWDEIEKLLDQSWAADPKLTLRIIWNLRSIHEGKSARKQFYRAYAWLFAHHPHTAVANLHMLVEPTIKQTIKRKGPDKGDAVMVNVEPEKDVPSVREVEVGLSHGCWKDLLNILLLATLDQLHPTSQLAALAVHLPKKENESAAKEDDAEEAKEAAKVTRLAKHIAWHNKVVHKLEHEKPYRALYVTVARLFAEALSRDLNILREVADTNTTALRRIELSFKLSLAGKWAPSLGGSHDRVTSISTAIAHLLAFDGQLAAVLGQQTTTQPLEQAIVHKLRSAYARWVTAPLRRFMQIPEVAMSAKQWGQVNYRRVASKCMRANTKHFIRHDRERFSAYIHAVAEGRAAISGATLLPHELLVEATQIERMSSLESQVIDAQWKAVVDRIREAGTLDNSLAVCDVSGSMGNLCTKNSPIAPAIALSLLVSQVARPPWANSFITFSENPEIINLDPAAGLAKTAQTMESSEWGMNTDFNAVFTKLILPMAIEHKLRREDMIKRLFVFSDMQFDASRKISSGGSARRRRLDASWANEHQRIKARFTKAGYEMPEIVYWNLQGAVAKPVTKDEKGVALVSGFSPGMLKVFLESGNLEAEEMVKDSENNVADAEKKRLDPIDTMLKALGKESYAGLQVFD